MIQRIQTVYLLLSLILIGLMAWLPLGEITANGDIFSFGIMGVNNSQTGELIVNGWPLLAMLAIIELVQLAIIFGYKNRVRQMRFATFNILLMLGLFVVGFIFVRSSLNTIGDGAYGFKIAMSFPFVAIILNYLAIRAIGKDEALVRSIDRIR
ncbi:MAG: DUF4293 domain-containing protein [Candidatus Atribacteria bacterium]|jgi:glucan phosphoethanolaminetransferase (alkaline phosphatase superfamily)|nr:DUF4293 domain-containing protein [Candidatus Atribacteria bacterium]